MLSKCCRLHNLSKWYWFFWQVMWADRITVQKRFGCSPFFMVTGTHPILLLDVQEGTWLVKLPDRMLTTEELIGYRARALAKHRVHVADMRKHVSAEKQARLAKYEKDHRNKIDDRIYGPGDLVLVRNSVIESSMSRKMRPRYLGPVIVIHHSKGGSYIVCELDGSVWQNKVGTFRIIPYFTRRKIHLEEEIGRLIDLNKEGLDRLDDEGLEDRADSNDYAFEGINLDETSLDEDGYSSEVDNDGLSKENNF